MTNSMTAFGQATLTGESGDYVCEIRTVNHRYLEVHTRLPEELRALENTLREKISSQLTRGRVDCFIKKNESKTTLSSASIDEVVVQQLQTLSSAVAEHLPETSPLRMTDVLRWPGVLVTPSVDPDEVKRELEVVVGEALVKVKQTRANEGEKLAALINQRLQEIRTIVTQVNQRTPEINQQYRQRLEEKLDAVKNDLDESRLEQEMVIYLQKSDVMEELDRLNVHVDEVEASLKQDKPKGRRLDFLMQELNREANTLGSKSHDAQLTQYSVELKVLIEQMREQVQNIE
ncbi:MAG: YicC/YloC family endoribonuclease [Arenicella sp.]